MALGGPDRTAEDMSSSLRLLLLCVLPIPPAIAAEEWLPVDIPKTVEGALWVDKSSLRFDGSLVTASMRSELQAGIYRGIVTADCAKLTIRAAGGEFMDRKGSITPDPARDKFEAAPSGTIQGAVHRVLCDMRPTWRRLIF